MVYIIFRSQAVLYGPKIPKSYINASIYYDFGRKKRKISGNRFYLILNSANLLTAMNNNNLNYILIILYSTSKKKLYTNYFH